MTNNRALWVIVGVVAAVLLIAGGWLAATSGHHRSDAMAAQRAEEARAAEALRAAEADQRRVDSAKEQRAEEGEQSPRGSLRADGTQASPTDDASSVLAEAMTDGIPHDPPPPPPVDPDATPTPTPTPDPRLGALAVRVIDQLDNPLAEFSVVVRVEPNDPDGLAEPIVAAQATTDEKGEAAVPALLPGSYELVVSTPLSWTEEATQTRTVTITESSVARETLTFSSGDNLGVIVLDASGEPIAGAAVWATIGAVARTPVETDANGLATVQAIPHGAAMQSLTASHAKYVTQKRDDIRILDGTQTFRLELKSALTLRVMWEADDAPVEAYTYRLLRRGDAGVFGLTPMSRPTPVESADGSTPLNDGRPLDPATWRVEVLVTGAESGPTALRGAATFEVKADGEARDVVVKIGGGATLRGRVADGAKGGAGVPDATVSMTPPHQAFGQQIDDRRFVADPVVTDDAGNFAFANVPPGSYALVAEKGSLKTAAPTDVTVGEQGGSTASVELVMQAGGVLYGVATGPGRLPIADASIRLRVQKPNADGWENGPTATTNDAGEYRVEGLPAGAHYAGIVLAEPIEGVGSVPWSVVNIGLGTETRHDFDLSGDVVVSGRVTLSGKAPAGRILHVMFASQSVQSAWAPLDEDGRYSTTVAPGVYALRTAGPLVLFGESAGHTIAASPAEQTIDLDIPVVSTDVILVFPPDVAVARGQVVLMPETRGTRYNIQRIKFEQENRYVATLIAGRYQATFTSFDKQWRGETEWTDVVRGGASELVIDVFRTVDGARIGGWAPGDLSNGEWRVMTFDATQAMAGAKGTPSVVATYEKGRHAVELRGARLRINNNVASEDRHAGWTGSDHWGNRFRLPIGAPQAGARYVIEIDMKSDGGNDSMGSVYLSVK